MQDNITEKERENLKICFIADGRSIHTQRWIEYFAYRHEVHLITYDPMGISIPGVTEHVVGSPDQNLYLSFWPRHLRIFGLINKIEPDLIHAHFIAKYGFHLPFLPKIPSIVTAWGDDILILPPKSRLIHYFTGLALNHADLVYAVSHDIRDHIIHDFGITPEKVRYMPFGINTQLFSPVATRKVRTREDNEALILFSNRQFYPVYDNPTLIKGFSIALKNEPNMRLILKSDGPDKSALQYLVVSLGLNESVIFKGLTSYDEVPYDYQQADIFITTALSDGTPVSLLEAMSSALPCIATAVGGIPEWIHDGTNGLLIPPGDPEMLAAKILELAADPSLREKIGKKARATVREAADWGTFMSQAEEDYEELVQQHFKGRS